MDINVVDHPLVGDRLRMLRDAATDTAGFRAAMDALGTMLCYEAFREVPTVEVPVTTPVTETTGIAVDGSPLLVPVLRAGLGLLDPATRLLPGAQVGFIGLARDEQSHEPVSYLCSLPGDLSGRHVLVLDPMLATGGSLVSTLETLAARGAADVTVVCVLCAPEGIAKVRESGLAARLFTATIDDRLDRRVHRPRAGRRGRPSLRPPLTRVPAGAGHAGGGHRAPGRVEVTRAGTRPPGAPRRRGPRGAPRPPPAPHPTAAGPSRPRCRP